MLIPCLDFTLTLAALLGTFLVGLRAALLVVTVQSTSMVPALHHGDRVLVWRYWPQRWLRRGHIVLVWPWLGPTQGSHALDTQVFIPFIKRIVGLPGDYLVTTLTDLAEHYRSREHAAHDAQGHRVWWVQADHIFVCGDAPLGGLDSLTWGPIPARCVLGLVLLRLPPVAGAAALPLDPESRPGGLPPGTAAPDFAVPTLAGVPQTLANYLGRSTVFLFIARCEPCQEVIPAVAALQRPAAQAGVALVLVSTDPEARTRTLVEELDIRLPVLLAPPASSSFMVDYGIQDVPTYCLVDAQGRIQSTGYPSRAWGTWKELADAWTTLSVSDAGLPCLDRPEYPT